MANTRILVCSESFLLNSNLISALRRLNVVARDEQPQPTEVVELKAALKLLTDNSSFSLLIIHRDTPPRQKCPENKFDDSIDGPENLKQLLENLESKIGGGLKILILMPPGATNYSYLTHHSKNVQCISCSDPKDKGRITEAIRRGLVKLDFTNFSKRG